jgi:hypothetical protein
MKPDGSSYLGRYAVCLLAMGFAIAGRAWAEHMGWGPYRFPFVQAGVIVAAAFGGVGPGMLAVVLGTFGWFLFLPPVGTFRIEQPIDFFNLIASAGVNVLIVWAFATARKRWRASSSGQAAGAGATATGRPRPQILLQSPAALAGLLAVVAAMAAFGCWGMFIPAGAARFDDETALIPLTCLGAAPALLIMGLGFLPVFSFHAPRTPPRADAR